MKRAPVVLASTAAGLGLVLSFHTHAPKVAKLATGAGGPGAAGSSAAGASSTTAPTTSTPASTAPASTTPASGAPASTTPTTAASTSRRATSEDVQYRYGDIQLQVTETGSRIANIAILQEGATDPRSEDINSQALPVLQRQALNAQSANIDGVSGATFTSAAYAQALQSALDQLAR